MKHGKLLAEIPLLIALIAAPVAGYWCYDNGAVCFALFVFFLMVASLLDSWIVFCLTISAFISFGFAMGVPYSGNDESRFDTVIVTVIFGTAIGTGIGVLAEVARSRKPKPLSDSRKHLYGHTISINPVKTNTD